MNKNNEIIEISGERLIEAIKEIELILVSLHKMGAYYGFKINEDKVKYTTEYEKETTRFIDENRITHRLASARKILCEAFDLTLGDDDMDDIERSLENTKCWNKPGDNL